MAEDYLPNVDCLTCGHHRAVHRMVPFGMGNCIVAGCTCLKFEPTGGGDHHDLHRTDQPDRSTGTHVTGPAGIGGGDADDDALGVHRERTSTAGTHVTGPAGAIPPTPAGPPHGFNQTIQDLLYPDDDGQRSCTGCGAIPGRGHAPIGHAPLVECPVKQLEALLTAYESLRDQFEPAGPPDLQQAIQAATGALQAQSDPYYTVMRIQQAARIAVEAAWHLLVEQVAGLQAKIERLREALHASWPGILDWHLEHCQLPKGEDDAPDYEECTDPNCPAKLADAALDALNPAAAPEREAGDG